MTMPFGRYRGWRVDDLPDDYLNWLLTIDLRSSLHVREEYDSRRRRRENLSSVSDFAIRLQPYDLALARRVFDAGDKALAKKLPPDLGGDAEEMKRLNAFVESVRLQFAALEESPR
jgi:Putative quorum-sensing-regulated virulence factor